MRTSELEKLLFDPSGLEKLKSRAVDINTRLGISEDLPSGKLLCNSIIPEELIKAEAGKTEFSEKRAMVLGEIGIFNEALKNESPIKILDMLTKRYSKEADVFSHNLFEDSINRILLAGELTAENEKLIEKSIEVLSAVKKTDANSDTDSIWSRVYEHSDYRGRSFLAWHDPGYVYRLFRKNTLQTANLHDRISSLYVDASASETGGYTLLFEHDRYNGRYAKFNTTPGNPSARNYYPYVGNFMNDRTSSMLIVRRYPNELAPVALSSYGIRDEITELVNGISRLSMRGNPIITWDMWPEGPTSGSDPHPNDPSRRFIYLKIPIRVDVPSWFDYDAELRFWVYLYISGGRLNAYVAYYGAWVEGGVKHNSILDRIMAELPGSTGMINERLSGLLELLNLFGPFTRQYFLPGNAAGSGYTTDDISIVVVR